MRHNRSAAILAILVLLGTPASGALAAEPYDPGDVLVVRLEATSDISPLGPIVSLHADGRLIVVPPAMEGPSAELRLSPEEVAAVREMIAETGLFGPDAPATTEYLPQLRPGKDAPGRGSAQERIVVGRATGSASAIFELVSEYEADLWFPSPEAERLAPLTQLLRSHFNSVWPEDGDPAGAAYSPKRYQLTLSGAPGVALDGVKWPLATPPEALPVTAFSTRFEGGWQRAERLRCATLTAADALLVAQALGGWAPYGTVTDRLMVQVAGEDGETQMLFLEALLPDERGCGTVSPDTALIADPIGPTTHTVVGFALLVLAAAALARRAARKASP